MEKGLKELLESNVLSADTKKALSEAWDKKTEELRESVKAEVINDFKARFEEDKNNLSLAMNDMLGEAVKKYATESGLEVKRLKEERKKLTNAIVEMKQEQQTKIAEATKAVETFVLTQLKEHVTGLEEEKAHYTHLREQNKKFTKAQLDEQIKMLQKLVAECLKDEIENLHDKEEELEDAKRENARKVKEHRIRLNNQAASHIAKLDKFVEQKLEEELAEFHKDKRALVEAKAKVLRRHREQTVENNKKLADSQKEFISRASKIVESSVNASLKNEIVKMKKDIKAARENTFARKIYESFKEEFKSGYVRDNTEMKELMAEMRELRRQVNEANQEASEQRRLAESARHKARMSEERAARSKVMSDLLRPLSKDKREAMENLLESTRTANLKEAFRKYLPSVMSETVNKNNGRTALIEGSSRTVTGNKVSRLTESATKDNQADDPERLALLKLAGIRKD